MNRKSTKILGLAVITALFFSCKEENKKKTSSEEEHHGINLSYMDTTVSPKEDFYSFVNGSWMEKESIPEDQKSWGSFQILRKTTDDNVLSLLNHAIEENHFSEGSDQAKAVALYHSQLDKERRDKEGVDPVKPALEKIAEINSIEDLQKTLSENPGEIANPFFGIFASAKPTESSMNGAFLSPGGLGLPDRDYYTNDDAESKKIREQYVDHITRMLGYLDIEEEDARDQANKILAIETKLAEPRMTKEERRDARKRNNPRSLEEIGKMTSAVDWKQVIDDLPVKKEVDTLIVTELAYMDSLDDLLKEDNLEDIKTLISWQTLNNAAGRLSTDLERTDWEFYSKTLNGTPEQRPEEERALARVNGTIGEALGKIFVEEYFPPEAKETAETMVENVLEVFKDRIQNLDWMTEDTKEKAIEKVNALTVKIGYPDDWKDYSTMDITEENSLYENIVAASKWRREDNLSRINEPVDTTEWFMNPQTVNAYFSPSMNEIVFPAAILQPPFFDYQADPALNFGGIGAVIGHEISHAFDDSGARFDAEGNLNNWWTDTDLEQFEERTKKLADFYSNVEVEEGLNLNGEFTLGENTADLGGVLAAYHGLQRYFETNEKPEEIDGFTQEQRFFLSWATVWRTKTRSEALRSQIKTDPHAPGHYRAYLPLQNTDEFYEAFEIQEGDSMYIAPEDRVRIW